MTGQLTRPRGTRRVHRVRE